MMVVHLSGLANQRLGEVSPDAPVAMFVGMSQCAAGNRCTHSHMIELCLMGTKTALDVPKSLPIGKLRKCHTQVLIHAREGFDISLAVVSFHAAGEFLVWDELHHLRKDCASSVHGPPPYSREYSLYRNSNRSGPKIDNCEYSSRDCQS